MENVRLYLLKIILVAIVLFAATIQAAHINKAENPSNDAQKHIQDSTITNMKKAKRSAYGRSWAKSASYNTLNSYNNNNFPPYLVFNRKIGAYYPYYKYPSDNNIRRNTRKMGQYHGAR